MWVEKIPRRSDFCGCPGCGLCYDWATDEGAKVPGVVWVARELTGKKRVSRKDRAAVRKGAKAAHARLKKPPKVKAPTQAELLAAYDERIEKQFQAAALKKIRLEKKKGMGISKRTVLIDNLALPTRVRETGGRQYSQNVGRADLGQGIILKEVVMSDGSTQWIAEG
jgi:hypothetical protein